MKTPFPLYAKIVLWFFLNLLVVCVVAWGLLRARFGDSTDWLLASDAKARIQSMAEVLTAELDHTPAVFQSEVLERFSNAYHLVLSVYTNDGRLVLGNELNLPPNVKDEVNKEAKLPHNPRGEGEGPPEGPPDGPPPQEPPPRPRPVRPEDIFSDPQNPLFGPMERLERDEGRDRGPPPAGAQGRPENRRRPPAPPPGSFGLDLVRTDKPAAWWLLIRAPVLAAYRGSGQRVTLVGRIDSLTDNGLLFDLRPWVWWGVALLLFSALFWVPLVSSLTRAISKLTRATERIAEGDFDVQINEQRRDELGRLGHAINTLSARLAGFVRGQKRFLGDIAHELCSPLARMEMGLGVIEQRVAPEMHERVGDVQDDLREMRELVNELLSFSKAGLRTPDAPLNAINVHDLVAEAVEREGDGNVVSDVEPQFEVLADSRLLLRAVGNLVRNAVRYAGHAGVILVNARCDGDQVRITVADSGPGVPEEALPRLFDAFYRPDEARSRDTGGVGLGLAIVKSCVEACGGTVTARNREEGGFAVEMKFRAA